MKPGAGAGETEALASRYAALWENGETPDLSAFLSAHPDATSEERRAVIQIDQDRRGGAGPGWPAEPSTVLEKTVEIGDTVTADGGRDAPDLSSTQGSSSTAGEAPAGKPGVGSTKSRHPFATDDGLASPRAEAVRPTLPDTSHEVLWRTARFEIGPTLGTGGMGVVYQAYDRVRKETLALKTMRRADPRALYRFKQEFRTLSDLMHPNLVNLYELFALGDLWFFTMELVEGTDFVSHVRSRPIGPGGAEHSPEDLARRRWDRLREVLKQLAEGVIALHEAGKLHRDIKPTNVLITPGGRVVLLDFGVSMELKGSEPRSAAENQIVGTVPYMAPEQAGAAGACAASDWYSVGVVLYESMTGRLPFRGRFSEVLAAKRDTEPPPPGTLVAGIPADLNALCIDLLRRDPASRPSGREILTRLGGGGDGPPRCPAGTPALARTVPLVGRQQYLRVLDAAFASLKGGRAEAVFVSGRSGTGKSALIQSFLNDLVENDEAVVLPGRCHERESVPYRALDSVVDALSRHLAQLGADEAGALLPADVSLLARVFPVLQRIEPVALAPRPPVETPDQRALRRRAFAALRRLLSRIGQRKPLVVAIDDLQWGDAEDAAILIDLLGPPDPPPLLFLGTFRSEDAGTSPILRSLLGTAGKEGPPLGHRELAVEALSLAESRELALALLSEDHAVARAEAHLIARESAGNPLFIGELVRHAQGGGLVSGRPPSAGAIDLDQVLWDRVGKLSDDARRLFELVAVSGRPISQTDAIQAAGLAAEARAGAVARLRAARLIRSTGPAQRELVEIYHDRIRETIVAQLPPAVVTEHHRRLVLTLESGGGAEPEVLAFHCRGAGQLGKAGRYYAKAADKASEELAFLHAARLYRQALPLHPGGGPEVRQLLTSLGDALANAGRGGEAAQAYLEAAASAMVAEALDLKRRAAMQLLISGHVDEGLDALRTVLGAMDMALPSTPRHSLALLLRGRARLWLRGLKFRPRDVSQVSAEELARIDVCWSSATGLSIIDPIRGAHFQTRGLLLALRAGEPYRVARALAMEAAGVSTAGGPSRRRLERLLAAAEPIVERLGHPHLRALTGLARAIAALMCGRWREARDQFDRAETILRDRCTGVAWELDTAVNLSLWALTRMGDLAALRSRWPALLREARERGDLYAATTLNTYSMTILRLADDDPEAARCALDTGMAHWTRSGFHIQHSSACRARIHILLYQGRWRSAWDEVQQSWPFYVRSMLLRVQMVRIELLELRARCALAAAAGAEDARPFWRSAERDAHRLDRERMPWADAHACFLRACLARARGQTQAALTLLADAAGRYQAVDMLLEAAVARRRLGEILGGEQGAEIVRETDEWLGEQGVRDPDRLAAMLAPPGPYGPEPGPGPGGASLSVAPETEGSPLGGASGGRR